MVAIYNFLSQFYNLFFHVLHFIEVENIEHLKTKYFATKYAITI